MQHLRLLRYPLMAGVSLVIMVGALMVVGVLLTWKPTIVLPWVNNELSPLQGFYESETDTVGAYHWSRPEATIEYTRITTNPIAVLQVVVSDSGRAVAFTMQSGAIVVHPRIHHQTRRIALLLPIVRTNADTQVTMQVPPFVSPSDDRPFGIRIRSVAIKTAAAGLPALGWLGGGIWLALLISVSVWLCRVPLWLAWCSGALIAPFVFALMMITYPGGTDQWLYALARVVPIIPLLMVWLRWQRLAIPPLLLLALVLWLLVRLVLVVNPAFEGHDFLIHTKRLYDFQHLHTLTLIDHPYEFNGRPGLVLPLFYWMSDGLARVWGVRLAMHSLMVCAESMVGVVVWLILRQCQVPVRTAGLAVVLMLAMPIATTVLWWSFMPQVLAHCLTFVAIYCTLRRDRWGAIAAGVAMAGVVWTHIGEILIVVVWYVAVRMSEPDRWLRSWWWRWLPVVVLPLSATSPYLDYLHLLANSAPTSARSVQMNFTAMVLQMKEGLAVGFAPIVWWLTPALAVVAWRRLPHFAPAWVVTVVFWLGVELFTGYQVRYGYLAVPLIAIALAYCLTPLTRYGRAGWLFVATIVLFVTWVSLALWVDATLFGIHPRVDGLSH